MKKHSIGFNALVNGFSNILSLFFPLITFPYISRILSVQSIGIFNFSNTYISYFILIAALGIPTYAVREGAKYRVNRDQLSKFSSQIFTINIVSTVIAYLLLFISLVVFSNLNKYITCILIFSTEILFTTLGTEWIYTIYENYSYIALRSILFKIVSILFLFLFVKSKNDYLIYAAIIAFATVGSNILNFFHAREFVDLHLTFNTNWRNHIKPILIIFANTISVTIYSISDVTLLGLLKNDYAVGIYTIATRINSAAVSALGAIITVTIPRLALLLGRRKIKDFNITLNKVINSVMILIFPAGVGLMMLSREVILLLSGPKYLRSVLSLQILCFALIISAFSRIFSDCILIPAKREKMVLKNTVITAVLNVVLNFILIPSMSYDGTSLSTVISEFCVMVLNAYDARDILKHSIRSLENLRNFVSVIIGCIGIVIVCIFCNFNYHLMLVKMALSVLFSIVVYICILILLKNTTAIRFLNKLKYRLK